MIIPIGFGILAVLYVILELILNSARAREDRRNQRIWKQIIESMYEEKENEE